MYLKRLIWWAICPKYTVGVFTVVFQGNSVLLIYKKRGIASIGWQLPGGGKKRGLSPSDAANQELYEETGKRGICLKLAHVSSDEKFWDTHIIYWTEQTEGEIEVHDTFEIAEAKFYEITDAVSILKDPFDSFLIKAIEARRNYHITMSN